MRRRTVKREVAPTKVGEEELVGEEKVREDPPKPLAQASLGGLLLLTSLRSKTTGPEVLEEEEGWLGSVEDLFREGGAGAASPMLFSEAEGLRMGAGV